MRKTLKALALTICATALCGALAGCEADKAMGIDEFSTSSLTTQEPASVRKRYSEKKNGFRSIISTSR